MALHKQLTNSCTAKPSWLKKKNSLFLYPDAKILPVHSWDDKFIGVKCQYDLSSHLLQSWPYLKHSMHNCIMGTQLNWVKKHTARQDKIKAWEREERDLYRLLYSKLKWWQRWRMQVQLSESISEIVQTKISQLGPDPKHWLYEGVWLITTNTWSFFIRGISCKPCLPVSLFSESAAWLRFAFFRFSSLSIWI